MIKNKLSYIVMNKEVLLDIFARKFPGNVSFRLMLLIDKMNSYLEVYDRTTLAVRNQFMKEMYVDQDGKSWPLDTTETMPPGVIQRKIIPQESVIDFKREIDKLLEQEVEFDFEPISIEELGDKHELSPMQLYTIKDFIKQ